jgi:hypothetical protein
MKWAALTNAITRAGRFMVKILGPAFGTHPWRHRPTSIAENPGRRQHGRHTATGDGIRPPRAGLFAAGLQFRA